MQPDLDLVVAGRWRVRGPGSYLMAVCPESDQVVLTQEPATFLVYALSDMRLGVKWTPRVTWCSLAEVPYVGAMAFGAPGVLLVLTTVNHRDDVAVVDVAAQRRLGTLWEGFQPDDGRADLLTASGDLVAVKYCMPRGQLDVIRIFRRDSCAGPLPSWTLVRVLHDEVRSRCLELSSCGAYLATVWNYSLHVRSWERTWHVDGPRCFWPPDWLLSNVLPYEGHWIAFGYGKSWYVLPVADQKSVSVHATRVRARARPSALARIPGLGLLALERGGHLVLLQPRNHNAVRYAWMGAVVRAAAMRVRWVTAHSRTRVVPAGHL